LTNYSSQHPQNDAAHKLFHFKTSIIKNATGWTK